MRPEISRTKTSSQRKIDMRRISHFTFININYSAFCFTVEHVLHDHAAVKEVKTLFYGILIFVSSHYLILCATMKVATMKVATMKEVLLDVFNITYVYHN